MKTFFLAYSGGAMPKDEEESKKVIGEWTEWYTKLGSKVKDPGFPFLAKSMMTDGNRIADGNGGLSGFTIIEANNFDEAMRFAKECPVVKAGAVIDVYERMEMEGM